MIRRDGQGGGVINGGSRSVMRTGFVSQSLKVSGGSREAAHADIAGTCLQLVQPESVAEQSLGQPDTRHASSGAICITAADELRNGHDRTTRGKLPPSSRGTSPLGEITPYGTIRAMISIDRDRLRQLIQERGTTARALSRAVGSNDTLVRDILSGKSKNARGDTMAKIAEQLGVAVGELMSGVDTPEPAVGEQLAELPLIGPVQAGAWLALDDSGQDEPQMMAVALDRRYPQARQWLREVRGDSMNARNIYPGDLAHIVEFIGSGVNLNTGMIVEVTRTRDDGALREITLKEVEVTESGLLLWPRSNNARWQDPVRLDDDSGADLQVEVSGLLIAKITRF